MLCVLQGRTGYLQWRENLKGSHAATVVGLMEAAGYDTAACEKVKRWILKKDIKTDPENQVGQVSMSHVTCMLASTSSTVVCYIIGVPR